MKARRSRMWKLRQRFGRSAHAEITQVQVAETTVSSEPDSATLMSDERAQFAVVTPAEDQAMADLPHTQFDRELKQYQLAEEMLTERKRALQAKMDECRDGGDLLVDYQRYYNRVRQVDAQLVGLGANRSQYIADRDRLASWGSTDDWVVAGSIVTIRYLDGDQSTFVLTERPIDTEYETVSYESPLGQTVRRRKVGDKVSLPAGAPLVIVDIIPGFRVDSSSAEGSPIAARNGSTQPIPPHHAPAASNADRWIGQQQCSDKAYRDDMYRRRTDPNVRSINEYVDRLRSEHPGVFIPYVAPTYGGVHARLLTLMQDPGPKTDLAKHNGSGMICLENADLTAARQKYFMAQAGIDVSQIVSWNAYPWAKPHPQTDASDLAAAVALRGFLELLPHLQVVILNGVVARRVWGVMKERDPRIAAGIWEFPTRHTSPRAVDPAKRSVEYIERLNQDLGAKYIAAGQKLNRA
ncbi:GreA/GreB family elongation factor [Rhodococcus sp. NPDC060086]|uniref:GreA/GreB family elongation factor n=1 Tax=Rhodococcus sp. NPDC060086 TaxID=3347055 RepID=UPI00366884B4